MTLDDILARARKGKAMVIFKAPGGDGIYLVEQDRVMDEEIQRELWRTPGEFYIAGGEVPVHSAWTVEAYPDTPEALRIALHLGLAVTAHVSRPVREPTRH
jgi:hypothetical protein